ncbi:MAG: Trk system potassium transporter TrkA [Mangrovibacterium sp.]
MKIVIVGAGQVGLHLAKMLSDDDHDIILMDNDVEKLNSISSQIDLLTVNGYAQSFSDLKNAGVGKADLFVAVTPLEERNILSCTIAKDMGAKKTLARINNGEYLKENYKEKLQRIGVDELIYPESLAGKEVASSVKQVGTRQFLEFSGGKLLLMGIKIHNNAPVLNKTFEELSAIEAEVCAVAINRSGKTIIPRGKDQVLEGDIIFFTTTRSHMNHLFELTGKAIFPVKNIMIIGGSRIGQKAVERLGDGYNIKIIENDPKRCEEIADRLANALIICGDGRDLDLLREEHMENMDAFIAVTGSSETNILACHMAKQLGIKRTVAEVENNEFLATAESMDIGSLINKKLIAASYIYKYTLGANKVSQVKCLTAVNAEVFELIISEDSKIVGKPIKELGLPKEITLGGVISGENAHVVKGDTCLQVGDRLVVFALRSGLKKIRKFFSAC